MYCAPDAVLRKWQRSSNCSVKQNLQQKRKAGILELSKKIPPQSGCVARNLRGMLEARNLTFLFSLGSRSKQAGDTCRLLHAVSFFSATYLTFPKHVHDLISLQGSPSGLERKETHP
jgi:hypothetical protein